MPSTCTCMQVLFGLIRHTCREIVWWAEMFSAWEASLLLWVVVFVIDQLLSVQAIETQWNNKWESKQVQGVQMVYVMFWDSQSVCPSVCFSVRHSVFQSLSQLITLSIILLKKQANKQTNIWLYNYKAWDTWDTIEISKSQGTWPSCLRIAMYSF